MAAARAGARAAAVTWGNAKLLVPQGVPEAPSGPVGARGQPPLTCWTPETVPWAVCSAELTDDVPVIEAWIAVQMACDTCMVGGDGDDAVLVVVLPAPDQTDGPVGPWRRSAGATGR